MALNYWPCSSGRKCVRVGLIYPGGYSCKQIQIQNEWLHIVFRMTFYLLCHLLWVSCFLQPWGGISSRYLGCPKVGQILSCWGSTKCQTYLSDSSRVIFKQLNWGFKGVIAERPYLSTALEMRSSCSRGRDHGLRTRETQAIGLSAAFLMDDSRLNTAMLSYNQLWKG